MTHRSICLPDFSQFRTFERSSLGSEKRIDRVGRVPIEGGLADFRESLCPAVSDQQGRPLVKYHDIRICRHNIREHWRKSVDLL
jgi:hypothetical protein